MKKIKLTIIYGEQAIPGENFKLTIIYGEQVIPDEKI
jgi:hypothetical protein